MPCLPFEAERTFKGVSTITLSESLHQQSPTNHLIGPFLHPPLDAGEGSVLGYGLASFYTAPYFHRDICVMVARITAEDLLVEIGANPLSTIYIPRHVTHPCHNLRFPCSLDSRGDARSLNLNDLTVGENLAVVSAKN